MRRLYLSYRWWNALEPRGRTLNRWRVLDAGDLPRQKVARQWRQRISDQIE